MHQKIRTSCVIIFATASVMAQAPDRSPYELLNCLEARDRNGVAELLKHVSVNTRFNPQGNTVLMTAIDMYAQRLAQRSPIVELEVGKAVTGVAALCGCIAACKINIPQAGNPVKLETSDPTVPVVDEVEGDRSWSQRIPGYSQWDKIGRAADQIKDEIQKTCDNWNNGGIPVNLYGPVSDQTGQKICDAMWQVESTCHDVRTYMRTSAIIGCGAAAVWLGIKTVQNYLRIQKQEQRYRQDIELYETIIDELLAHDELNFEITNNAGETVADLMRRLVISHASDEEIMARLLTIERKILHAARSGRA